MLNFTQDRSEVSQVLDGYSFYPVPASHRDTEQHCSPFHKIMQHIHFAFKPHVTATLSWPTHKKKNQTRSPQHITDSFPATQQDSTRQFTQWQAACYFIVLSNCPCLSPQVIPCREYGGSQSMAWVFNELLHSLVHTQRVLSMGCQGSLAQQAVAPGRASSQLHSHCLIYTASWRTTSVCVTDPSQHV